MRGDRYFPERDRYYFTLEDWIWIVKFIIWWTLAIYSISLVLGIGFFYSIYYLVNGRKGIPLLNQFFKNFWNNIENTHIPYLLALSFRLTVGIFLLSIWVWVGPIYGIYYLINGRRRNPTIHNLWANCCDYVFLGKIR